MATDDDGPPEASVRETYTPDQDRTLTQAVLTAIENQTGTDLHRSETTLYDCINSDALNTLFQFTPESNVRVRFKMDTLYVTLWEDAGVEIRVTDRR